jgi:mycobactin lysine-N-oxygenase
MNRRRLLIIGAGPKAIALACKARVLRDHGFDAPEIVVIEKHAIGANWLGKWGYTDGKQLLCTTPEKDLGFPYKSAYGLTINRSMMKYSWQAHLVDRGVYSEWIDRGRLAPAHASWVEYLKWVGKAIALPILKGEVEWIENDKKRWNIRVRTPSKTIKDIEGDGLVITGPGRPEPFPGQPIEHNRIFDGKTFWSNLGVFKGFADGTIGVIGSGETAATIVMALADIITMSEEVLILVINRQPTIFSRGESFDENRYFEATESWRDIPLQQRRALIERTDRGVFSLRSKGILNRFSNIKHEPINVRAVSLAPDGKPKITGNSGKISRNLTLEYLIVATSFDPLWFRELLAPSLRTKLERRKSLEPQINNFLAVPGIRPPLHVPMLAALAQGPGFPNLTCLGDLSDRILLKYCRNSGGGRHKS